MSRKTIALIVIIVISLVIGSLLGFYFYLYNKSGSTTDTAPRSTGFFGLFNKKQNEPQATSTIQTITQTTPNTTVIEKIPRLRKITSEPVAGADYVIKDVIATSTEAASTTAKKTPKVITKREVIRWMERGTGNIFETATSSLSNARISNTTISQIQEAYFTDKGDTVIYRKLVSNTDTIETRFGKMQLITPTSTIQSLTTSGLPINISYLSLSPDKTKIFAINNDGARGVISRTDGSSKTTVYDSVYKEWLTEWPTSNGIIMTTKPSGTTEGYSYLFNPETRSFVKILGNKLGLTTLASPDTNKILFSELVQGAYQLNTFDRKTNKTVSLFLKTFPEKCVWSKLEKDIVFCAVPENMPYSTYPDTWYQGRIAFADNIWRINASTGETRQILKSFDEADDALDMTYLTLSAKEDSLLFRNKNDLSLWSYQIKLPEPKAATSTSATTTTPKR
ncbi:MAG: hypothetical protein RL094_43 [Candidatus Parcubacteria bacterium]|jgi:hypothetical protein